MDTTTKILIGLFVIAVLALVAVHLPCNALLAHAVGNICI